MPEQLVPNSTESSAEKDNAAARHPCLYPSLYQVNTRILMEDFSRTLRRPATLDDISEGYLDQLSRGNFDWVWFLGVWQTGRVGPRVSRENREWRCEFEQTLPDLTEEDICGSCFAITKYEAHTAFGGNAALDRLRDRVHRRGMKLLLDFVPNHTALDHPWVSEHPEFYIEGTDDKLQNEPQNYIVMDVGGKPTVLAYGRDPYFAGWPDTLQLNYAEPALRRAMMGEIENIARHCDGIRCDMAMLILSDVFERTWGRRPEPFWPEAIKSIRKSRPDFLFMAEVYWDLEWTLQQQGFNYTYDKRLYDRLREGRARPVRDHFRADMDFQTKSARFLENHDEPRAAAVFPREQHRAAAVLTFLCPGLRFFHDGQFDGRSLKASVHLCRRPAERVDPVLREFYERLLGCINIHPVRDGVWSLLECSPAWEGNWTSDCFVCFAWEYSPQERVVAAVNYAPNQSQCYLHFPFADLAGYSALLQDLMSDQGYQREGRDLAGPGLFLDIPGWGYQIFRISVSQPE